MTQAYPLAWPHGRPRRRPQARKPGKFGKATWREGYGGNRYSTKGELTVADARRRLQDELDRLGARLPVISSNMELRLDGLPRSGAREPEDPGVAVYFQLNGKPHCMPCDTYLRVADNLAAVAAHIEATRAIERHGVATVAEMFAGFQALPAPGARRPWWEVLGFVHDRVTLDAVEEVYRSLARKRHPDAGGSVEAMAELNAARDEAREALKDA